MVEPKPTKFLDVNNASLVGLFREKLFSIISQSDSRTPESELLRFSMNT